MDITKLTTGGSIKKPLDMKKTDVNKAVKAWNTSKAETKLTSLATIYDKADQIQTMKDILSNAGIEINENNLSMLESMIDSGLSLDLPTLQKMKQQNQLFNMLENKDIKNINLDKSQNLEKPRETEKSSVLENTKNKATNIKKSIFTLKNDLPINKTTTELTNKFSNSQLNLSNVFESLATDISNIQDHVFKKQVIDTLVLEKNNELVTHFQDIKSEKNLEKPHVKPTVNQDSTIKTRENIQQNNIVEKHVLQIDSQTDISQQTQQTQEAREEQETQKHKETLRQVNSTVQLSPEKESISIISKNLNQPETISIENLTKNQIDQLLNENYRVDLSQPKEVIDKTLDRLSENIRNLSETIINESTIPQTSEQTRIFNTMQQINQTINFSQSLHNAVYIPLPLVVQEQKVNAELFVFKDGKNKNKKTKGVTSALIGLDTLGLGRIETYIQKNGNNISLQFRLDQDRTSKIIKQNINKLTDTLKISSISYFPMDKPFEPIELATPGVLDLHDGFSKLV